MNKYTLQCLVTIAGSLLIMFLIALANREYTIFLGGYSLYLIVGGLAFLVNWLAFLPSYKFQTEHYYDLTGSLTYLLVVAASFIFSDAINDPRAILIASLPCMWTIRLGTFLFFRVKKTGADSRFDEIRPMFARFLTAWTFQALWAFVTLAAALAVITSTKRVPLDAFALVGFLIWIFGFGIETVADQQKSVFKKNPSNKGMFICSGLWRYSRHPNYFGEVVLWIGVFIIAVPVLDGWQWTTVISPIFVYLLITKVSGVTILEEIADERWGDQPSYQVYKRQTSKLLLLPKKSLDESNRNE